jgi:hypothetical protein
VVGGGAGGEVLPGLLVLPGPLVNEITSSVFLNSFSQLSLGPRRLRSIEEENEEIETKKKIKLKTQKK